jgi:phosphoribosylformylglycinamidine synthase
VPTLGGEVDFDSSYNGNILVNAMCLGLVQQDKIFRSQLETGCSLLYVGARTGRDGIQGAVMASASFEGDEASRTAVQIGDPFMQKLLLESCLEMMKTDAIIGLQDMGAAGLTSSSVEMAEKSGCGIVLDLDKIPTREDNMSAYEIMLSESQERMLIAIRPEAEAQVKQVCEKWDVACVVIGKATDDKKLIVKHQGKVEADLPIALLVGGAPEVVRLVEKLPPAPAKVIEPNSAAPLEVLVKLLNTAELCSRRWIAEQYDQSVMGDTLEPSGGDSALVRVHKTRKALALVSECTPRYCSACSYEGAKQAVAECFRNLSALGAKPLAITDCLNFASPEDPKIMGQFSQAIDGMSEAARILDMPVISGNVSFYNETDGKAIMPTPTIGAIGLIEDYRKAVSLRLPKENLVLLLVGSPSETFCGMTLYQKYILEDRALCAPPKVELEQELQTGLCVRELILSGIVKAAHDVGSGGLAVALAEMALASGQGIRLDCQAAHPFLFDEAQGRYVIACEESAVKKLMEQPIPLTPLGISGGDIFSLAGAHLPLSVLESAYENFIPNLMEA